MEIKEFIYKLRGIDPQVKKNYVTLFNSSDNKERGTKVIEDLILRFKFYGAPQTNDPIQLARQAAHREVIEYIMTMAARISDDTMGDIEKFINK